MPGISISARQEDPPSLFPFLAPSEVAIHFDDRRRPSLLKRASEFASFQFSRAKLTVRRGEGEDETLASERARAMNRLSSAPMMLG